MKVKVVANELVDTDIEMVSLVRHGANRVPFKILKAEDDEQPTLSGRFQSFFSLNRGDFNVTGYFIRKDAAEAVLPILKAAGIDISKATEADGVIGVLLSDTTPHGFIQLNDALAVAVDRPIREFGDESIVKAYAQSLGLDQFAPGVSLSVRGLADAVWTLLNPTDDNEPREERVAKVDSMLASFRKYITALAKALPAQVFQVEAATDAITKTEDDSMRKRTLTEAVPGDLDGIFKADDEEAVVEAAKPVIVAPVESKPEVAAEAAAPVAKDEVPADPTPAPAPTGMDAVLKALESISAKVDGLAKAVDDNRTETDSLKALVAEVEGLSKSVRDAPTTTVVQKGEDVDFALASLGGSYRDRPAPVVKTGEALWDGLFPELDSFRPAR